MRSPSDRDGAIVTEDEAKQLVLVRGVEEEDPALGPSEVRMGPH